MNFVEAISIKARGSREVLKPDLDGADLAVAELYWIRACQGVSIHDKNFEEWKMQFGLYLDAWPETTFEIWGGLSYIQLCMNINQAFGTMLNLNLLEIQMHALI